MALKNPYLDQDLLFNTMNKQQRQNIFTPKKNPISICCYIVFGYFQFIFCLFYLVIGLYFITFPILRITYIKIEWWMVHGYFVYLPFCIISLWIIMICSNKIQIPSFDMLIFSFFLYVFAITSPVIIRMYIIYKIIDFSKLYLNCTHIPNICDFISSSTSKQDKLQRLLSVHYYLLNDHWFWMLDLRTMATIVYDTNQDKKYIKLQFIKYRINEIYKKNLNRYKINTEKRDKELKKFLISQQNVKKYHTVNYDKPEMKKDEVDELDDDDAENVRKVGLSFDIEMLLQLYEKIDFVMKYDVFSKDGDQFGMEDIMRIRKELMEKRKVMVNQQFMKKVNSLNFVFSLLFGAPQWFLWIFGGFLFSYFVLYWYLAMIYIVRLRLLHEMSIVFIIEMMFYIISGLMVLCIFGKLRHLQFMKKYVFDFYPLDEKKYQIQQDVDQVFVNGINCVYYNHKNKVFVPQLILDKFGDSIGWIILKYLYQRTKSNKLKR